MSTPEPASAEAIANELFANGNIGDTDRAEIEKFAQFLREAGPAPKLYDEDGPKLRGGRWSIAFIRRWKTYIGMDDQRLDELIRRRAGEGDEEALAVLRETENAT
jgi:hypothetical protein